MLPNRATHHIYLQCSNHQPMRKKSPSTLNIIKKNITFPNREKIRIKEDRLLISYPKTASSGFLLMKWREEISTHLTLIRPMAPYNSLPSVTLQLLLTLLSTLLSNLLLHCTPLLTQSTPVFHFFTPWKCQETRCMEMECWCEMGLKELHDIAT